MRLGEFALLDEFALRADASFLACASAAARFSATAASTLLTGSRAAGPDTPPPRGLPPELELEPGEYELAVAVDPLLAVARAEALPEAGPRRDVTPLPTVWPTLPRAASRGEESLALLAPLALG